MTEVLEVWRHATTHPSTTDDIEALRTLRERSPDALLLAIDGGATVGTVIVTWDGWRGSMYRLAVVPAHRRRGVATALVAEGEQRLRGLGARRLHMIVGGDEPAAQAFWSAVGYEATGQLRFVKNLG